MTVKKMLRRAAALLTLCLLAGSVAAGEMEKGTRENPYRLGEACAFSAEVLADGSPRLDAAETDFAAFELTLTLDNYLSPAYFEENYGRLYKFDGTQAGAQVTIANERGERRAGNRLSAHGRGNRRQLWHGSGGRRKRHPL